ncbi:MAG: L-threonylcarbamoyladenylate synthase [Frankiaceae bacterium]|jgi:tRNA threonylcarbamoyl adenosine modification protein (Sua5/YciO/YrdC/YwlC family)|nr:L-threonylcarbamoyladenylate synthase [Frankiaceae bacterium]MDQ1723391.1 L-threonylcarbamoyladenylate synthase [Frankiaceae bacterium]
MRRYDCSDSAARESGITDALRAIRDNQLIVLPTDTVYGIGADAFSPLGIDALLEAKGRGRDMPVPVLVGNATALHGLVDLVPQTALDLVDAFWPGALTIVLKHAPALSWDLGETRGTVAVRMPLHPVALDLLLQTGPLGVSSANRSGAPPAMTVDEAMGQLGESVAVYLDGGTTAAQVPSTIVDLTGLRPRLLRAGAVTVEALRGVLPDIEVPE